VGEKERAKQRKANICESGRRKTKGARKKKKKQSTKMTKEICRSELSR